MNTNTQTPRTDAAEHRDITGLGIVAASITRQLERDLARVTAERDAYKDINLIWCGKVDEAEMERAALRARNAELESTISTAAKGNQSLAERLEQCEYFREQDTLGLKPLNERAWKAEADRDRLAEEVSQLKAALELGQENCDDAYDDLREEQDAARAELAYARKASDIQVAGYRAELDRVVSENAELKRESMSARAQALSERTLRELVESNCARIAAERDEARRTKDQSLEVIRNQSLHLGQQETTIASLRARVAELEALDSAVRAWLDSDSPLNAAPEWQDVIEALGRAESATPAPQSQQIDAESLIAACIPGGSICDPQQVADAIREYLRPQEPCGGQCGDPDCNLDTYGVTMRTPAPHADTVRLDWLSRQHYGFPVSLQRQDLPAVVSDHPSPYLRVVIDAAMKGGRP